MGLAQSIRNPFYPFVLLKSSACLIILLSTALIEFCPATCKAVVFVPETVDSLGNAGLDTSIALDSYGAPHITYQNQDFSEADTTFQLKHAWKVGGSWTIEVADTNLGTGKYSSVVLDEMDQPHVSYWDELNGNLKYARKVGNTWEVETVDVVGRVGEDSSLDLDSQGNPHIAYKSYMSGPSRPKYAHKEGGAWFIEFVGTGNGTNTRLALDSEGIPHIAMAGSGLLFATRTSTGWTIETVDASGSVGLFNSLKLDGSDIPHISYLDQTNFNLKYATLSDGIWITQVVDHIGVVGEYTSLALGSNGEPLISYHDRTNTSLKLAEHNAGVWLTHVVDSNGYVGRHSSLAIDGYDRPHISYRDDTNDDLKYVTTMVAADVAVEGPAATMTLRIGSSPVRTNASIEVHFELPETSPVRFNLFDVLGRRVGTFPDGIYFQGQNMVTWNPRIATPGIYYLRLSSPFAGVATARWVVEN